jgi:CelD/BcsL family acetyltransferase involved in cellulose biosynthesis
MGSPLDDMAVPAANAKWSRIDAGRQKAAAALVFQAHQGLSGLQRLTPEWMRLVDLIPGARFNHFPEWYRAYLTSSNCDPANVWFIAAYREGQLVAICPLQFQNHRVPLLHPRYLGTIEGNELQLSDFVFAPVTDNAWLLYELTRWLRVQRTLRWDVLRLVMVSEDSSLGYAAKARSPSLTLAADYDASAYFDTSGTYDQATRAMSAKMRSNLRRRTRLAASLAPLRFESCRRADEVTSAFEIFLDLESSGWKGPTGNTSSIRCRPRVLAFYTEMVREFTARNQCVINLLWHGEQAIAAQLGLHLGRTLYILKVGYLDTNPTLAPGILLQDRTIRNACEHPEVDVLSMVNDPHWVHSFKPNTVKVRLHCISNWSAQGLLAHLGLWLKRSWLTHAPKSDTVNARVG